MRLGPLNLSALVARSRIGQADAPKPDGGARGRRRGNQPIECWRCSVCDDVHDYEEDARECCPSEDEESSPENGKDACPVCGQDALDFEAAAHCCMWKDFDHATRCRIAGRVERGASWVEAIEQESN